MSTAPAQDFWCEEVIIQTDISKNKLCVELLVIGLNQLTVKSWS